MRASRRRFIKVAGLAALGLAVPALGALAGPERATAGARKRLALFVDPAKCAQDADCEECIAACHKAHNVPDLGNPKDEVKWVWKETYEGAFGEHHENHYPLGGLRSQSILVLCNHCDNPPCVRVCPTQATWKRESDGIVMMDLHRCIGCRFCIAGCPYGARSFNYRDPRPFIVDPNPDFPMRTKGVAEKCNFCEERLAKGLQPACVEACREKALVFGDLEDPNSDVRKLLAEHHTLRRRVYLGTRPQVYYIAT